MRALFRRLPPVARRDATIRALRRRTRALEAQVAELRKRLDKARGQRDAALAGIQDLKDELEQRDAALEQRDAALEGTRGRLEDTRRRWASGERAPWRPPTGEAARAAVRASGLFDTELYLDQLPADVASEAVRDPLDHFLAGGVGEVQPHPLFLPTTWARRARALGMARLRPADPGAVLLHYLGLGRSLGAPTHPLLEGIKVDGDHAARSHPGGLPGWLTDQPEHRGMGEAGSWAALVLRGSSPQCGGGADESPSQLGVVMAVAPGEADDALATLTHLVREASVATTVVVVTMGLGVEERVALAARGYAGAGGLRLCLVAGTEEQSLSEARLAGAQVCGAPAVALLSPGMWPTRGWDAQLIAALEAHPVVQPLILDPSGSVWSAGVWTTSEGQLVLPHRGLAGDAPEVRGTRPVPGCTPAALATTTAALVSAGSDPRDDLPHSPVLSWRLVGQGDPACVGDAVLVLGRDPYSEVDESTRVRARRQLATPPHRPVTPLPSPVGSRIESLRPEQPSGVVLLPLLARDLPHGPRRWALKIGAPDLRVRETWGDWYFAVGLAEALRERGQEVTIDCRTAWSRPSAHLDDVVVALPGRGLPTPVPGQVSICWVISHPEDLEPVDLRPFDLLFAASEPWARQVSDLLGRAVQPLLQCTDPRRFAPGPVRPELATDVLAVANRSGRDRPGVMGALEAGFDLAVYGGGWDGRLPDGVWRGTFVENSRLAEHYRSAGAVVVDHWAGMRADGFIGNRVFDLAACGARAVVDDVPGIAEVFGPLVRTYTSTPELAQEVEAALAERDRDDPAERHARLELAMKVRSEHTFAARAAELVQAVERHTGEMPIPQDREVTL